MRWHEEGLHQLHVGLRGSVRKRSCTRHAVCSVAYAACRKWHGAGRTWYVAGGTWQLLITVHAQLERNAQLERSAHLERTASVHVGLRGYG